MAPLYAVYVSLVLARVALFYNIAKHASLDLVSAGFSLTLLYILRAPRKASGATSWRAASW